MTKTFNNTNNYFNKMNINVMNANYPYVQSPFISKQVTVNEHYEKTKQLFMNKLGKNRSLPDLKINTSRNKQKMKYDFINNNNSVVFKSKLH